MTLPLILPPVGVAGRFKLVVRDGESMQVKRAYPWFKNLVLDNGLNLLGSRNNNSQWCQVGTSNAAPSNGQTSLVARVAGANGFTVTTSAGSGAVAPYWTSWTHYYRFGVGVAVGNLSEIGIGPDEIGNLFSRALITDAVGTPITITILPDEVLDVYYEIRRYQQDITNSGSIVLNGITYNYQSRPYGLGLAESASYIDSVLFGFAYPYDLLYISPNPWVATTAPKNLSGSDFVRSTYGSYSMNSKVRNAHNDLPIGTGTMNIKTMYVENSAVNLQIQFDNPIPKTASRVLTIDTQTSWDRYVL